MTDKNSKAYQQRYKYHKMNQVQHPEYNKNYDYVNKCFKHENEVQQVADESSKED